MVDLHDERICNMERYAVLLRDELRLYICPSRGMIRQPSRETAPHSTLQLQESWVQSRCILTFSGRPMSKGHVMLVDQVEVRSTYV